MFKDFFFLILLSRLIESKITEVETVLTSFVRFVEPGDPRASLTRSMLDRILKGDVDVVKDPLISCAQDWQGQHALHMAVLLGHVPLALQLLLHYGLELLTTFDMWVIFTPDLLFFYFSCFFFSSDINLLLYTIK